MGLGGGWASIGTRVQRTASCLGLSAGQVLATSTRRSTFASQLQMATALGLATRELHQNSPDGFVSGVPPVHRSPESWRVGFATRPHRFPGCILGLSSEHCTHRAPHAATHRLATRGCSGAADGRVEVLSCGGVCRWRLLPCSCTSPLNIRCSGIAA